ncbi:glycosyltransferase [Flavisolibacter sp. BT320]|nr:glycosyltransferase [Flavisolibacter longurius]
MHIAFFVSSFPVLSETFIVNQIVGLKRCGHKVHIYAQTGSAEEQVQPAVLDFDLLSDTIFLDRLPKKRAARILKLLACLVRIRTLTDLRLFTSFLRRARSENLSVYESVFYTGKPHYDVVHAHFGVNGNYVAKLKRLGLFSQSRFVTTFHGYDLEASKASYTNLFRVGDVFATNSDYSVQKLVALGCPVQKLKKIPVGLDVTYFNNGLSAQKDDKCFTILYVGRLVPFKGPDMVIRICDCLRQLGLSFQANIVGEGEMRKDLQAMITEYGLERNVRLLGAKTQVEVRTLMSLADVFLLPGRTVNGRAENQGLVIQEAQAMGLPVIVSNAGGMKEGITDGETGFVVAEDDIVAFANKIESLATNEDRRKTLGNAGRELVIRKFDMTLLTGKLLEIYAN